ncbi:hypothetical protein KQY30_33505 [Streptomyces sp. GMY02]|uniref:hypothetical protein n=1 Tax=Streptomyces sp. GMY02 TaxID=1333528 RepID=UPI001C2BECE7|nr:hypothetical protein [Streptomyces sp. GMY02]QXE38421.1 hypothetical protein KQY30_33505 [Streptomyces sp. GMY02]
MSKTDIFLKVRVQVLSDHIEEFKKLITRVSEQPPIENGPASVAYYYDDQTQQAVFLESHVSSAALLANIGADDGGDRALLGSMYELIDIDIYGTVNDQVRSALGAAATYYRPF